jgi:hypothetical protein
VTELSVFDIFIDAWDVPFFLEDHISGTMQHAYRTPLDVLQAQPERMTTRSRGIADGIDKVRKVVAITRANHSNDHYQYGVPSFSIERSHQLADAVTRVNGYQS